MLPNDYQHVYHQYDDLDNLRADHDRSPLVRDMPVSMGAILDRGKRDVATHQQQLHRRVPVRSSLRYRPRQYRLRPHPHATVPNTLHDHDLFSGVAARVHLSSFLLPVRVLHRQECARLLHGGMPEIQVGIARQ